MEKPQSKFVSKAIARLPFNEKNRHYVRELFEIERLAVQRPATWSGAMLDESLRQRRPAEYDAIARELNPNAHSRETIERACHARAWQASERQKRAQESRARDEDRELWRRLHREATPRVSDRAR